ncbi:hypothetical protein, partial [Chloroflexus sp.]|uniref:hypothetical protein n=1 Tax=Chloroflexus sp. TaxID=1904827 RepID=UPI002ADE0A41
MASAPASKPLWQRCAYRLSPEPNGAATFCASEPSASFPLAPGGGVRAADGLPRPQVPRHGSVAVDHSSGSPGGGPAHRPRS